MPRCVCRCSRLRDSTISRAAPAGPTASRICARPTHICSDHQIGWQIPLSTGQRRPLQAATSRASCWPAFSPSKPSNRSARKPWRRIRNCNSDLSGGEPLLPKRTGRPALAQRVAINRKLRRVIGIKRSPLPADLDQADAEILVLSAALAARRGALGALEHPAEGALSSHRPASALRLAHSRRMRKDLALQPGGLLLTAG